MSHAANEITSEDKIDAILRVASDSQVRAQIESRLGATERRAHEAYNVISKHEEVCLLRYDVIKSSLNALPVISASIASLEALANKAIGIWFATMGFGTVVGIIVGVYKLTER